MKKRMTTEAAWVAWGIWCANHAVQGGSGWVS